jgi:hypothetical protein
LVKLTYWISEAQLKKKNCLLPGSERGKVDRCQTANGYGADAVEERVNICDVEKAIAGVEYS